MRTDLADGSKRDCKRRCRTTVSRPVCIPAIRCRLLPCLSLPDHQCSHGSSTDGGIGARRRGSRPPHVGLFRDFRRRADTHRHPPGPIWSATDPERIIGSRRNRLGTVRDVRPFSGTSGRPRADRSWRRRRLDRWTKGPRSLVSQGARAAPQRVDGHAGCARRGDRDVAGRPAASLDRLAVPLWSIRCVDCGVCCHDLYGGA